MEESDWREQAFEAYPGPLMLVGGFGEILEANAQARTFFGLAERNNEHPTLTDLFEASPGQHQLPALDRPLSTHFETIVRLRDRSTDDQCEGRLEIAPFADDAGHSALAIWHRSRDSWAEAALLTEHHHYRSLFEQSHDAVFILDLEGRHLDVNMRAAKMLGYTPEEIQRLSVEDLSVEHAESRDVLARLLAGETVAPYERVFRRKDGARISVEINAEVVRDADGKPLHIQSMVRDITERKADEALIRSLLEEKDLLLREIHHRVKNNLSTLIAMVNLEAADAENETTREAMETIAHRVTSMLLVYDSLFVSEEYETVPVDIYLGDLVERLSESHSHLRHISLESRVEPMQIPAKLAFPVGIAVTELVTNAIKHAFPSNQRGVIRVEFYRDADRAILAVEDNGNPGDRDDSTRGTGFGSILIDTLVNKIQGSIERTEAAGTRVEIAAPLTSLIGPSADHRHDDRPAVRPIPVLAEVDPLPGTEREPPA